MPRTTSARTGPVDPVSAELRQVLRNLKLGRMLDTLPERLTLARQQQMPHADFLELVLADEVTRRETNSAALRIHAEGFAVAMMAAALASRTGARGVSRAVCPIRRPLMRTAGGSWRCIGTEIAQLGRAERVAELPGEPGLERTGQRGRDGQDRHRCGYRTDHAPRGGPGQP